MRERTAYHSHSARQWASGEKKTRSTEIAMHTYSNVYAECDDILCTYIRGTHEFSTKFYPSQKRDSSARSIETAVRMTRSEFRLGWNCKNCFESTYNSAKIPEVKIRKRIRAGESGRASEEKGDIPREGRRRDRKLLLLIYCFWFTFT